jgi:hypothetical protein
VRKLVIGMIVLGVLLALYVGYARIGGTPPPGLNVPKPMPLPMAQTTGEPNVQGGRIGDTRVITVGPTRFFHRAADGRVDREFGFEVILHKQGDRWRCTHPYMRLHLPRFLCEVTADAGEGQVQNIFGQLIPNDALFQGNVVIHIIPPKRNDPRECFIYLDDVTFVAEKSLFSSPGPVRFVSRSARLEGTGMELVYDSLEGRLELFRIVELASLRIRSADVALFSGDKGTAGYEGRGTGEPVAGAVPERTGIAAISKPADDGRIFYECILRDNATIDTPQRIVIARDLLSITDIPWMRSAEGGPAGDHGQTEPSEPDTSEPAPVPMDTKPPPQIAFDAIPEESFDIIVTCSGGLIVAPAGRSGRYVDPNTHVASPGGVSPSLDINSDREQAVAKRIEYNATTGDAALIGQVRMVVSLDPNSLAEPAQANLDKAETRRGSAKREPRIPMTITARDAVRYTSASNRVVFDGNCVASAEKADPNVAHAFALSAPKFVLDVVQDVNASMARKAAGKAVTLKWFSTDGGPASLVVSRRAGRLHPAGQGRLLGWTRVNASQLEYDAVVKLFSAHGPGELQLNNAWASSLDPNVGELRTDRASARGVRDKRSQTDPNAFGFNQPCYAFLRDFDLLTFGSETNRIVVTAGAQPILIDYIPVIKGGYGQPIRGDAGHLDLTLLETAPGRMEIASLVASKGVTYEDRTKQFAGSTLTYDRDRSLITVVGDDVQPCRLNGALVPQIEMDTTTGNLKTQFQTPGVFQGKR